MKPKKKLTNEEYQARGMLLNDEWEYVPSLHAYDCYPNSAMKHKWIDADTLEVIPLRDLGKRTNRYRGG